MTKALIGEPTASPSESIHGVDPRDHVATALRDLLAGEALDLHGQAVTARADIPKGHKIAVRAVAKGDDVLKYGWPIGRAVAGIALGDHRHVPNGETRRSGVEAFA